MSTDFCTVYVTCGNREEALALARAVVGERLAACANVLGAVTSVYEWEGKTHEDEEVALLLKTRRDLVQALTERIGALHSYDCPCVVAWPIETGADDYLEWVREQTEK